MSDRENEPSDLFDCICRLDDLAEWLKDYPDEAAQIQAASDALKGYIELTADVDAGAGR